MAALQISDDVKHVGIFDSKYSYVFYGLHASTGSQRRWGKLKCFIHDLVEAGVYLNCKDSEAADKPGTTSTGVKLKEVHEHFVLKFCRSNVYLKMPFCPRTNINTFGSRNSPCGHQFFFDNNCGSATATPILCSSNDDFFEYFISWLRVVRVLLGVLLSD